MLTVYIRAAFGSQGSIDLPRSGFTCNLKTDVTGSWDLCWVAYICRMMATDLQTDHL